jgi:hypothetical protein
MAARIVRIEERLSKFLEQQQQASPYIRRRIEAGSGVNGTDRK